MAYTCGEPTCTVDCRPFICLDCSANTMHIDEYYMVTDEIWRAVVPERYGMLCIGCLEGRLGRKLSKDDFSDAPLNGFTIWQSQRLRSRLTFNEALSDV